MRSRHSSRRALTDTSGSALAALMSDEVEKHNAKLLSLQSLPSDLDTTLLVAYQILLAKHCRSNTPNIHVRLSNKEFTLNQTIDDDCSVKEFTEAVTDHIVRSRTSEMSEDSATPTSLRGLRSPSDTITPSFSAGFSFTAPGVDLKLADLHLHIVDGVETEPSAFILFRPNVIQEDAIDMFCLQLSVVHEAIAADSAKESAQSIKVGDVPLMSSNEQEKIVSKWNFTDKPWPTDVCIHHLFEAQAIKNPSNIALISTDRIVTYKELLGNVQQVSKILASKGVTHGTPVALFLSRSIETVVAIYASLYCGGFYVPIDTEYPTQRINEILNDIQSPVLITTSVLSRLLPSEYEGDVILMDNLPDAPDSNPTELDGNPNQSPATPVYCFFTSGSTGRPKGVLVEHGALVRRIQWFQDRYPLNSSDRVINKTPYVFGVSEWEFFWALPHGATLVVAPSEAHKDPLSMYQIMSKHNVTVGFFVPSQLELFQDFLEIEQLEQTLETSVVFACGEALQVKTCATFYDSFKPSCKLVNLYGPTEADITFWECPSGAEAKGLVKTLIGKPISNIKVYVLDGRLNPVPVGVAGELYFGAQQTGKYLNRPELNKERFLASPFGSETLYQTGDLAQFLPDGNLEYLGRVDNQVKLRGFRIELGEIEQAILRSEAVDKAVVVIHGKSAAAKLVAFVTPVTTDVSCALRSCKAFLPSYMIPAKIHPLSHIPMTDRQKIDRSALMNFSFPKEEDDGPSDGDLPVTPTELAVEKLWKDVLSIDKRISVESKFEDLGGSSLLAGRFTSLLRREMDVSIPGTAIYTHSSIRRLSSFIDETEESQGSNVKDDEITANTWKGYDESSLAVMLSQFIGIMFLSIVNEDLMDILSYVLGYLAIRDRGLWAVFLTIPAILVAELVTLALISLVAKKVLLGPIKPGTFPVYGSYYVRWWFVKKLTLQVSKMIVGLFGGTELCVAWFRLCGAKIGENCLIEEAVIEQPELLRIGSNTVLRSCVISSNETKNGEVNLDYVTIGDKCKVSDRAIVSPGTVIEAGSVVCPLSTTKSGNSYGIKKWSGATKKRPDIRPYQLCFGLPVLLLLHSIPSIPAIYALEALYNIMMTGNTKGALGVGVVMLLLATVPFIYSFIESETTFLVVLLFKRLVIGKFRPGPRPNTSWDEFRRWLLERIERSQSFQSSMLNWVGSEVLSIKYRLLGCKIGRRVHIDYFRTIEWDLVDIGDDAVLAAKSRFSCSDEEEVLPIKIEREAMVLDDVYLSAGVVVSEGALVGSTTFAPKRHHFKPFSISDGNQGGRPVLLRECVTKEVALERLPPEEREMSLIARRRHESFACWMCYQIFILLNALLLGPFEYNPFFLVGMPMLFLYTAIPRWAIIVLTPFLRLGSEVIQIFFVVMWKKMFIGRFKKGNYPFYGMVHLQWTSFIYLSRAVKRSLEVALGSIFGSFGYRALGATIGKNVVLDNGNGHFTLEHDLAFIGDEICLNYESFITMHTVENMVLKLEPCTVGNNCNLSAMSILMPGARMEDGSNLLPMSLVLKGETVPQGEEWAGAPAWKNSSLVNPWAER